MSIKHYNNYNIDITAYWIKEKGMAFKNLRMYRIVTTNISHWVRSMRYESADHRFQGFLVSNQWQLSILRREKFRWCSVSSIGRGCRRCRSCSPGLSSVVLGVRCWRCRVRGGGVLQGLGLLELLPVRVGPAEGGGHGGLHLDHGEGGVCHRGHQTEAGVHFVLFPLPGLDIVLLQSNWSRLAVNLLIKSASVTNYFSSCN